MRGAGSTYNDIIDRDIDAKVERTKWRPLASGRIDATAATVFLAAQCLAGLAVLLSFNGFTILLGFASLGVVGLYPFMKQISSWPQAVLGAAFAWGALVGWAAALGSLASAPLWLYLGAVFWTIGYDTIYAVQDIEDDAVAGIGSTARAFRRAAFVWGWDFSTRSRSCASKRPCLPPARARLRKGASCFSRRILPGRRCGSIPAMAPLHCGCFVRTATRDFCCSPDSRPKFFSFRNNSTPEQQRRRAEPSGDF